MRNRKPLPEWIRSAVRRARRRFNRNEWLIRWFHLSTHEGTGAEPGAVLIQIDGLSRRQLERALKNGRMPFIQNLLDKQHCQIRSLYPGLPSSTPAVQGELFHGVQCAVPAFGYYDKESQREIRMFETDSAETVEARLGGRGEPLLRGGSSYSNIYTGGSDESHFCFAAMGPEKVFRGANAFAYPLITLFHVYALARIAALIPLELAIALSDCARGLIRGRNLLKEIKFVPTRAMICILLRELIVIGVKVDAERGLPIIHANFIGYDEQAHRRGPSSRFAHWTLKGIDDAVKRIWRAARRSRRRDYTVWIFSDHGQEETEYYAARRRLGLQTAVRSILREERGGPAAEGGNGEGIQNERVRPMHWPWPQTLLAEPAAALGSDAAEWPKIMAIGPLGHIYCKEPPGPAAKRRLARRLVLEAEIPMVLIAGEDNGALAFTKDGEFELPRQGRELLGPDHPFPDETARDLARVCRHPNAGDFAIAGWAPRMGKRSVTFAPERGSHAGPGPEECHGFMVLPPECPLLETGADHARPSQLRGAAMEYLNPTPAVSKRARANPRKTGRTIRLMTYNVRGCLGLDGKRSPERTARVIAQFDPDITALQEVDLNRARSGGDDQAAVIAERLAMDSHFHPAMRLEEEQYGDAILSRFPMRLVKAGPLPGRPRRPRWEPRGALKVRLDTGAGLLYLINTHLGLNAREGLNQVGELLSDEWLDGDRGNEPMILCGDFNAPPGTRSYRRLRKALTDAQTAAPGHRPRNTFPSRYPLIRIDHVFAGPGVEIKAARVAEDELSRVASDHLPLIVDFELVPAES